MSGYANGWVSAVPTSWGLSDGDPGKEQFAIAFKILDGADQGRTITWFGTFASDAAFEYTVKQIKKCGWTGSDLTAVELSSEPVSILIEDEEFEGKVRTKVKAVGNGGGGIKQMDQNRAKSFAAKMAQRIKAFDVKNGTGAPAARPTQQRQSIPQRPPQQWSGEGSDDSDIPF
jgi:hypothetical protein